MGMSDNKQIKELLNKEYKLGFETLVESDTFPVGLDENVIKAISKKKNEPSWLLEFRLKAYKKWLKMEEPTWANLKYDKIDYQDIAYYSAPKKALDSLDEVDPEILKTYEKLGIPLEEQKMLAGVAVDAVFDSVSVKTTFQEELEKLGIIFCSISEAAHTHPEILKKYLASVVSVGDNYFSCLNCAVFRDERQLHAAVVELVALDNAQIKYSTIQNWYPGDDDGRRIARKDGARDEKGEGKHKKKGEDEKES